MWWVPTTLGWLASADFQDAVPLAGFVLVDVQTGAHRARVERREQSSLVDHVAT